MPVHENSMESFDKLDRASRRKVVLEVYIKSPSPMTDRQVAEKLSFSDMNKVRPRITELVQEGQLFEMLEKHYDTVTKRNVRLCSDSDCGSVARAGGSI